MGEAVVGLDDLSEDVHGVDGVIEVSGGAVEGFADGDAHEVYLLIEALKPARLGEGAPASFAALGRVGEASELGDE